MSEDTRISEERHFDQAGVVLFVGTVLVAFLVSYLDGRWRAAPLWRHALTTSFGILYVVLGTLGFSWAEGKSNRNYMILLFVVQIILITTIIVVGYLGTFWLAAVPLAGFSVALGWRGSLAVGLAIIAGLVGSIWYYSGLSAALVNAPSFFVLIGFVMVFSRMTVGAMENRAVISRLATELRAANQQLREYALKAEDLAVTKERNRMAREIHDGLGHYLTVVNVQLEAARTLVPNDPERATIAIGKAQLMAQEGLADVRRSVATLRESPIANRSVSDAIAELVADSNAAGIPTEIKIIHEPRPVSPKTALTLYRAAQEALTNVRKHAEATQATLTLAFNPDTVDLTVIDNGRGAVTTDGGFGLLGIRERVHLLNGNFHIQTGLGAGFLLELTLPATNGEVEEARL